MKRILFILILALACVLVSPYGLSIAVGAPISDSPAARSALEQSRAQAQSLMEAGKAAEAVPLYERLLAAYPDNPVLYLEAFRAYRAAGQTEKALALADAAKIRFKGSLMAARQEQGAAEPQFVLHGKVMAGVIFDSNANQGPSSDTMSLGDWKDVTVDNAKERSSFAAYAGAMLDGGYRLSPDGNFWVVGDASAYWRGNENERLEDLNSQEWQQGRLAVGGRYMSGSNLLDLRLKAEVFDYDFYNSVLSVGPELRYIHAVTPYFHLISAANLDRRSYNKSTKRNGLYGSAGEYARFFFGDAGHQFMFGASYLGASADKNDYSYDGWQSLARFDFNLPYDFTFSPYASFGQEYYKGPGTVLETRDRRDDRWRTGLDLTYAINESWSIESGYQYTDTDSTCNLYKYDQHVVRVGVAWSF